MTTPGQPPQTDAEWARNVERRLRQLESPNTARVGPWVLSAPDGDLIATKPGELIEIGAQPEEPTTVPDVTRGYINDRVQDSQDKISDSIGNPNGGGGIPIIKDYLNGKWDDLVQVTEVADARSTAGNNLVTNPGFEKTVFFTGDGSLVTDIKRTGVRSGALSATGSLRKLYLIATTTGPGTVTATAGDIFYVEAWVWGKSTNTQVSGGANGISIFLEVYNAAGAVIGQPLTLTGPTASNALNNQWTRFFGYIAIPTTGVYTATASISAYIGLNTNVTAGSVYYFDDPIVRVDSLVNSWNFIYDASNGTSGSTGKGPFDVFSPLRNVRDGLFGGGAFGASGGALNTASLAVSGASGARALAQNAIDGIVVGLKNTFGQNFLPSDAEQAASDTNTSLTRLQVITANLEAQKDAGMFFGTVVDEVLSAYPISSTLGSKWTQVNSGTGTATWQIAANLRGGVSAQVVPATGNLSRLCRARLVQTTVTRYQRIGVVFGGAGRNTDVYIYGRMSADLQRYVYVKFSGGQVSIGYNNGSGEIAIPSSVKAHTLDGGVTYWFNCGLGDSAQYTYQLWANNTSVTTGVDSSLTSPNSPTDSLGSGFGAQVTNATTASASVAGFALYDNVPPVRRGMGFRGSQITTSANFNLAPSSSNNNTGFFPDNWFLSEFTPPADMLYEPLTNTLTVSQPGYYLVEVVQKGSYEVQNFGVSSGRVAAAVFKDTGSGNFAIERIGPATFNTSVKCSFGFACMVYLQGGDRIRPGYWASWSTSGTSYIGSDAAETYFAVTFSHNSYTKITST